MASRGARGGGGGNVDGGSHRGRGHYQGGGRDGGGGGGYYQAVAVGTTKEAVVMVAVAVGTTMEVVAVAVGTTKEVAMVAEDVATEEAISPPKEAMTEVMVTKEAVTEAMVTKVTKGAAVAVAAAAGVAAGASQPRRLPPICAKPRGRPSPSATPPRSWSSVSSSRRWARPGLGSHGRPCMLRANHFFVHLVDKGLHHYDSTLSGVNRAVISSLVSEHQHTELGGRLPAYDSRRSLYTAGELPFKTKEFEVTLSDSNNSLPGPRREKKYCKVAIKHATPVSVQQLQMLLAGISTDNPPAQALQVLDIVLRDIVLNERNNLGYVAVGRSFFSPPTRRDNNLGSGVQGWEGFYFYQGIRPTQSGLSLNIDTSCTAFIQPLPLIDFVAEITGKPSLPRNINRMDHVKIKKALRGVRIEVTHRGDVRRKYRISDLTKESSRDLKFQLSTGVSKTVADYFRETYNLQLRYDSLPCLQVGNEQKPNYLPMEVCKIVPGQRFQKKLDNTQVQNMLRITAKYPSNRESAICQDVRSNDYNSTKRANEFGIEVDCNPTSIQARILPAPTLKYSGRENQCYPRNESCTWCPGCQLAWLCVNFCHDLSDDEARNICTKMVQISCTTRLDFAGLKIPVLHARPEQVKEFRDEVCREERKSGQKFDLLLAILPESNGDLYGNIKRICETDLGIMSQCCLNKKELKDLNNAQYFANISLKINAKCGGSNSLFDDVRASLPVVSNKPTIIFGADVTHPAALDDLAPSIACVVASQDWPEVTKYHGDVHAQGHREELLQGLERIVKELLQAFERESKERPQQLIFYRDGVSEGQFRQVLEREIPEIEKAWKDLYNEKANITFIVVQKRHHTRFFPVGKDCIGQKGNILPGTVVDSKICHPTEFDFFLCSHAGIKGTSRPTNYHVLRDDNNFTADDLQSLTYNLYYLYASCTRSVSIAPPAYHAHKLAYRARFYQNQGSGSEAASTLTSGSAAPPGVIKPLPAIKDELKRRMFYC